MNRKTLVLLIIIAIIILIAANVTVFEDLSWRLGPFGSPISGCLPGGLCNE